MQDDPFADPRQDDAPDEADELVDPLAPARDINEIWLEHDAADRGKYTTAELLLAIAISAVILSIARLFPPGNAAAGVGLLLVVGIVYLSVETPKSRLVLVTWWVLFVVYIILAAIAAWQGSPWGDPAVAAL